jgi:hypothetical protein
MLDAILAISVMQGRSDKRGNFRGFGGQKK